MAMVKYEPNRNVVPFSTAISKVFDEFFPGAFGNEGTPTVTWRPQVDILEHDDQVLIRADMPGLEKSNIKVIVNDGLLTIEGTRKEEHDEKSKGFVRTERFVGNFARSFNLPAWADATKIDANYKNGVLEVTVPKTEKARPKEVDIKVS
ncbi:MAG: Hsp20 family protein [candidate division Zixibacteria bacterium]|nr:Hsp20 family protein [candidate division Zixibacteria bacterium]